jgi:hypothetical protein
MEFILLSQYFPASLSKFFETGTFHNTTKKTKKTIESDLLTWKYSSYLDDELVLKAQGFIRRVLDVIIVLLPKHVPTLIETLVHIFNPDQMFYYQRQIPFESKLHLDEPFARLSVHFPFSSHSLPFI